MASTPVPFVNGFRYSYTSIEFGVLNTRIYGIKSINYDSEQKGGDGVYGTSPKKLGRVRGKHKPTCNVEMYRSEFDDFVKKLMQGKPSTVGIHDVIFDPLTVTYSEANGPVTTDSIRSCRIDKISAGNQDGTDPTTIKLELDVMDVEWNGQRSAGDLSSAGSGL